MVRYILTRPLLITLVILLAAAAAGSIYLINRRQPKGEVIVVKRGTVTQEVVVTGKTRSASAVDLGFEPAGRVVRVAVAVGERVFAGQTLAVLDQRELVADFAEAEANIAVQGSRLTQDEVALGGAEQNLRDKIQDAYTKTDDAVRNRVDQFISNPRSANPQLNFNAESELETSIEAERVHIESRLNTWRSQLDNLPTTLDDPSSSASQAREQLERVSVFLNRVTLALNALRPSASISDSTITAWRSDVSTARANLNTATINLSAAEEKLRAAPADILARQAELAAAGAKRNAIQARLAKTVLIAPISGVVTKRDVEPGEIVAANATIISIITERKFEIEANVPEADIAKIAIGMPASVTLDAYGSDVKFGAVIAEIEPAATVIEGVPTYKTTLLLTEQDSRVRAGMTADVSVVAVRRENVLWLPQRIITRKNGGNVVAIRHRDGAAEERKIEIGLRGSDGNVEVTGGLSEGEIVMSPRANR